MSQSSSSAANAPSERTLSLFQIGLRVSGLLARTRGGVRETLFSALRFVQQSGEITGARTEVTMAGQDGQATTYMAAVNWPPTGGEQSGVLLRRFVIGRVSATVHLKPARETVDLELVGELLAQQIALWTVLQVTKADNEALRSEIRQIEESVLLAKFVHRATSLIRHRFGLSEQEAEEWLLGASVRHERPLLHVARDVVTVFSTNSPFNAGAAA